MKLNKYLILVLFPAFCLSAAAQNDTASWHKLKTIAYQGKQDDIFFINEARGWYVNGSGRIYSTADGGLNWREIYARPGTYSDVSVLSTR